MAHKLFAYKSYIYIYIYIYIYTRFVIKIPSRVDSLAVSLISILAKLSGTVIWIISVFHTSLFLLFFGLFQKLYFWGHCYLHVHNLFWVNFSFSCKFVLFWLGLVLWHINHCRLFNAKSFLHIRYMISKHIL